MKTSEAEYIEIQKKHLERIKFLRSRLVYGDWIEVVKMCNDEGVYVKDTPHAINIIRSMSAKKHLAVFRALEKVIEKRINQFKQ